MRERLIAIIGARLNSSRLPGKQLLDLSGRPLITHVLRRLREIPNLDDIVLATTADDFNKPLITWAKGEGVNYYAYIGDVNNLMARVNKVVEKFSADILMYVCGDSPLIDPPTLRRRVNLLLADPDGDVVDPPPLPNGGTYIHEGVSIYRRKFWNRMVEKATKPFELEHVGAIYHVLNKVTPDKIVYAPEEPCFASIEHRISVDTPSDYRFMRRIYDDWFEEHDGDSIVDLRQVVKRLHDDPELRELNSHVRQKTVHESSITVTLLTQCGPHVGLGHVSRMTVAAGALQDHLSAGVSVVIEGPKSDHWELEILPHQYVNSLTEEIVMEHLNSSPPNALVIDMSDEKPWLKNILRHCRNIECRTIIVDRPWADGYGDLYYFPSFFLPDHTKTLIKNKAVFGWDAFLLPKIPKKNLSSNTIKNCIVLTGAADVDNLGRDWPEKLIHALPPDIMITWIQGPFAKAPNYPNEANNFRVSIAPNNLAGSLYRADVALCVYGVSLFECLLAGVPAVGIYPNDRISNQEWQAFQSSEVCLSGLPEEAAQLLQSLCHDSNLRVSLRMNAMNVMTGGGYHFAKTIGDLIQKETD
ncbi:MAG: hypothetical protein CBB68_09645 [Rhodospirillaceae bacterium TMED8]|nr:hypothetical protein [Magnetovibrio sp.]OUT50122.1 MAG: hypothetical protein CBB68_09645 [Rhodospirillaceae bacterium TMED8]